METLYCDHTGPGDSLEDLEGTNERELGFTCHVYSLFFEMVSLVNQASIQFMVILLPHIYPSLRSHLKQAPKLQMGKSRLIKFKYIYGADQMHLPHKLWDLSVIPRTQIKKAR